MVAKNKKLGQEQVRYEVITQEDPETGDLYIPIPQPLLDQLGWKEGVEVEVNFDQNGKMILRRVN